MKIYKIRYSSILQSIAALFAAILFIGGCSKGARFETEPLSVQVPPAYENSVNNEPAAVDGWVDAFSDPDLEGIVLEAMKSNLDVRLAANRVASARLAAGDAGADFFPTLEAQFQTGKSQNITEIEDEATSDIARSHGVSLNLSWELDLWGRLRGLHGAARYDAASSEADLEAFRLSIAGQTAKNWFSIKAARIQADLSRQTEISYAKARGIVMKHYKTGLKTALDVSLLKSNEADAKNSRLEAEQEVKRQIRSLEILLGRYPAGKSKGAEKMPELAQPIPSGLPAELLNRRPDVVAARRRVLAADRRTEAAERARLPRITLTASGGSTSEDFSMLLQGDRIIWNLGAGLLQPVFDAGRLKRAALSAEREAEKEWLAYAQVVLKAFQEVEAALESERKLADRQKAVQTALEAAVIADRLAWEQYLSGDAEIVTVLESHRGVLNARKSLAAITEQRLLNRIDLYLALGASPFKPNNS